MNEMRSDSYEKLESVPGRIFTRDEIRIALAKYKEGCTVKRELSDDEGIYLFEVEIAGEKPGEIVEYRFQRMGTFGENVSLATVIQIAYYDPDGIPEGGTTLATYNEFTDEWEQG